MPELNAEHPRKPRANIAVSLFGIYLILLGAFWMLNINFYAMEQRNARMIHQAGIETLNAARQTAQSFSFKDESERIAYEMKYADLKYLLQGYKQAEVDMIPASGIAIGFLAMMTALAYITSGVHVFRKSQRIRIFLKFGFYGFVFHYLMIIGDYLVTISPIYKRVTRLIEVFETVEPYWMFAGWGPQVAVQMLLLILVSSLLYILLPKYLLPKLIKNNFQSFQ